MSIHTKLPNDLAADRILPKLSSNKFLSMPRPSWVGLIETQHLILRASIVLRISRYSVVVALVSSGELISSPRALMIPNTL